MSTPGNLSRTALAGSLLVLLGACPQVLGPSRVDAGSAGPDSGSSVLDSSLRDRAGNDAGSADAASMDLARDDLALPGCGDGRSLCDGECVDLQVDPRYCGRCDLGCSQGEVCVAGECSAGGDCRETPCVGFSYCDQGTGNCLAGCTETAQCGANGYCDTWDHICECAWLFHDCGGVCVDNSSVAHCGDRCTPCSTDPHGDATCVDDQCGIACDVGYHLCAGSCVSDLSAEHCGTRCDPCSSGANGVPACQGGQCTLSCNSGYHLCGSACVADDQVAHCGELCSACPSDPNGTAICEQEQCSQDCDPGYHLCEGACVSDDDAAHCGDLCSPCPTDDHGAASCVDSSCGLSCDEGYRLCDGACAACPTATATACWQGACVATACEAGDSPCVSGCCSWRQQRFWEDAGGPASIAIDQDGDPQVSFYDYSGGETHELYRGHGYQLAEPVTTGALARDSQIRIRSDGQPVMAFYDVTADDIKLVTRASSYASWVTTDAVTEGSVGAGLAMVLDGNDLAHLSYYDSSYSEVHHAVQTSTGWTTEVVALMTGGNDCDTAIRLDGSGQPVIAYRDADAQTAVLATKQGGSWQFEILDSHGGDSGYGVDFAIAAGGARHVVYTVGSPGSSIRYATNASGTWESVSLDYRINSNTSGPGLASIALDGAGEPHVALTVRASGSTPAGNGVRYTRPLWGEWRSSIVNYWWYSRPRIALDTDDVPHIVSTRSDMGILFVYYLGL